MLALTRKTDYALVALSYLGQRRAEGDEAVSARRIAETFSLPLPLLMNILKDLTRARLVASTRGAAGGYTLAAEPEQISLLEVVTAIEGPVRLAQCADGLPIVGQGCEIAGTCPIQKPIRRLHERLNLFLEQTTLADLMDSRVDVAVERVGAG